VGLGESWIAVWDALKGEVDKVTEFGEYVYQTEMYPPRQFPSAYIIPTSIVQIARTTTRTYYQMAFIVRIFDKDLENGDIKVGAASAMTLAGKASGEITDERSLGGIIENVEDPTITYAPRGAPSGYERTCVDLNIRCRIYL